MPQAQQSAVREPPVVAFLVVTEGDADGTLRDLLAGAGFRVEMQRSFGEVREAVRVTVPDILIVHSRSALGPELAFYASLRAVLEKAFVPLVVMAESITSEDEVMALSAGVDAVLTAPFHPMLVAARLQSLLRIKALHDALVAANTRLEEISRVDPGTGLYNRRYFFERLEEEYARVTRRGGPLSVLMLDIDDFKVANDRFGHLFGDHVLRRIAGMLQNVSRRIDIVARYGGEEFAFILPDTPLAAAVTLAERVRRSIAMAEFVQEEAAMHLTVSIGVTDAAECDAPEVDRLVRCADKALYKAKSLGKNRVVIYRSENGRPIPAEEPVPQEEAPMDPSI